MFEPNCQMLTHAYMDRVSVLANNPIFAAPSEGNLVSKRL